VLLGPSPSIPASLTICSFTSGSTSTPIDASKPPAFSGCLYLQALYFRWGLDRSHGDVDWCSLIYWSILVFNDDGGGCLLILVKNRLYEELTIALFNSVHGDVDCLHESFFCRAPFRFLDFYDIVCGSPNRAVALIAKNGSFCSLSSPLRTGKACASSPAQKFMRSQICVYMPAGACRDSRHGPTDRPFHYE